MTSSFSAYFFRRSVESWRFFIGIAFTFSLISPHMACAIDQTGAALSAVEYGGSLGKLLWTTVENREKVAVSNGDQYQNLALRIKEQIDLGKASSSLVKASFDFPAAILAYAASTAPTPLTLATAGLATWGAKKTGDALGDAVIQNSEVQAQAILAQGLKNSGFSDRELRKMSPEELRQKVADFKIGREKIRDILKDDPASLKRLEAHAVDIATNIGVEALAKAKGTAADVKTIQADLAKTKNDIAKFQDEVDTHLQNITDHISGLEKTTQLANEKLDKLSNQVMGNANAIQTLSQISYSGWSTVQKLQAVESGLYSNLLEDQKNALVESLKADLALEQMASKARSAAQDFGNLASIAKNIGLPKSMVTGLQGAQTVAIGIAQYASGNYLGAIASATSLASLGAPDAGEQRHAAMMNYLNQQFTVVNQKLDKLISIQTQTFNAVLAMAEEQKKFRAEVLGQLDRIESAVLTSDQILQAVLKSQWTQCHALLNGTALNGQYSIPSKKILADIISNASISSYAGDCYNNMTSFFDAWVKPADWSGQIISATHFPTDQIAADVNMQKYWNAYVSQHTNAYNFARTFVLEALPGASIKPASYMVRFGQPVIEVSNARSIKTIMQTKPVADQFDSFTCDKNGVLAPALSELICFGIIDGSPQPPNASRWQKILSASLIGPHAITLIDTGITLSSIADFAQQNNSGAFTFVNSNAINTFSKTGTTDELKVALSQRKGLKLLTRLRWLAETNVLQQSIAYGSYTAELIEEVLYDSTSRSLNIDPTKMSPLKQSAINAMQVNPILARNVVMLAMRHAVVDSLGGLGNAEAKRFSALYYNMALSDFRGAQACNGLLIAREKLAELFPNWKFNYWVTDEDQRKDASLNICPKQVKSDMNIAVPLPDLGAGIGVSIANFYVIAPSPLTLAEGIFEQPDGLRNALYYRDRLNQEIVDREILKWVKDVSSTSEDAASVIKETAFSLMNEAWGWQYRKKAQ